MHEPIPNEFDEASERRAWVPVIEPHGNPRAVVDARLVGRPLADVAGMLLRARGETSRARVADGAWPQAFADLCRVADPMSHGAVIGATIDATAKAAHH